MTLCLLTRFKNERHILYEFINHYLLEGVDRLFLIDDNSTDDYLRLNEDWLKPLIDSNKVVILKSRGGQVYDYNTYSNLFQDFEWVVVCDADEFFFSVWENTTLKDIVGGELMKYDYIHIPWKLFKHTGINQPISVIGDNIYTHESKMDMFSPSRGYKYIVRVKNVIKYDIHFCKFIKNTNTLKITDCHNNLIQNNHYRTQSDEFLSNVKKIRGGGVDKNKYKNYEGLVKIEYNKPCHKLSNKRKILIDDISRRIQILPNKKICQSFI